MRAWVIIVTGLVLLASSPASAAEGVVVFNKSGCRSRYVVETAMGFAILEWYGGTDPQVGQVVYGDFESFGFKDVVFGGGGSGRVWVEDFWLSKTSVIEKMRNFCS